MKRVLISIIFLVSILFAISTVNASCHKINSGDSILDGYGPPFNPENNLLRFKGTCSQDKIDITLDEPNIYFYSKGYFWKNDKWESFDLEGEATGSDAWLVSSAYASLTSPDLSKDNYVLTYACMWNGSHWNCGCKDIKCKTRYWNLQIFKDDSSNNNGDNGDNNNGGGNTDKTIGALPSVQMPPASQCLYVKDFGADPNGNQNSANAIQQAINQAAGKKKVCIKNGEYKIEKRIDIPSNTHIVMDRNAILRRADGFTGTGSPSAMLRSKTHSSKINNVIIEGGKLSGTYKGTKSGGRMIDWLGDNWQVKNLIILDWSHPGSKSRAISYVGDNAKIEHVTIRNPGCGIGCGGIIVGGGNGHLIQYTDVHAGDDPIGFFPGAIKPGSNMALLNKDISNALVLSNKAKSTEARAFAMGLHCLGNFDCNSFTASVTDITVRDYEGYEERNNPNSMAVLVFVGSTNGEVRNIELDNIRISNGQPITHGIKLIGNGASKLKNVVLKNSKFEGNCKTAALLVQHATNVRIENNELIANSGCKFAAQSISSTQVTAKGNTFRGPTSGISNS